MLKANIESGRPRRSATRIAANTARVRFMHAILLQPQNCSGGVRVQP
jgi:hypothetical protein